MNRTLLRAIERRTEIAEYELARLRTTTAVAGHSGRDDHYVGRLYVDDARGRGESRFAIAASELGDADAAVDLAVQRAAAGTGPFWRLPPPSAPARVDVYDPTIGDDPDDAARRLANRVAAAARALPGIRGQVAAGVVVRDIEVQTSTGFRGDYRDTRMHLSGTIAARADAAAAVSVRVARRRRADVDPAAVLDGAARAVNDMTTATALAAGTYDVALSGDAIEATARDADSAGLFAPIVAHADGTRARRGLARYLPGQPVFPAAPTGDSLSVRSDGTLPFALHSAPFGRLGEPVRRFDLILDGVAAGLSLGPREAALRDTAPNGGVRNIVLAAGARPSTELLAGSDRPLLEIAELAWLDADADTGLLTAELSLGYLRDASGRRPVRGGLLRADYYTALAGARLSATTGSFGWYHGPDWIVLPDVAHID